MVNTQITSVDSSIPKSKKCLFAHGFEGLPTGSKNQYLSDLGWTVIAPTLFENGWTLSAQRDQVLKALRTHPDLEYIVASSMGAFASSWASMHPDMIDRSLKLVLLAPAFGVHDLFRRRVEEKLGSSGLEFWKQNRTVPYLHRGLQQEIQIPYELYIETQEMYTQINLTHPTYIIHGFEDESIPFIESVHVAQRSKGVRNLILCHDTHRLQEHRHLIDSALEQLISESN